MKRILSLAACVILATFSALAEVPAKSELALGGTFVNLSEGGHVYSLDGSLLFPLNRIGTVLLGPAVGLSSEDSLNRAGAALDFNLMGTAPVNLFIGASALYFLDDPEDAEGVEQDVDDHAVTARAGLKIRLNQGAALKFHLEDVVDGRGKDSTDLSGGLAIIARF